MERVLADVQGLNRAYKLRFGDAPTQRSDGLPTFGKEPPQKGPRRNKYGAARGLQSGIFGPVPIPHVERRSPDRAPAPDDVDGSKPENFIAPSSDHVHAEYNLETKKAEITQILNRCAEIAGENEDLIDFAIQHDFLRKILNPVRLIETQPRKLWISGSTDNPSRFIERVYGPPAGRLLRLDYLATTDPHLHAAYPVWIRRHPADKLDWVITKPEYTKAILDNFARLGFSAEFIRRIGSAANKQAWRSKLTP